MNDYTTAGMFYNPSTAQSLSNIPPNMLSGSFSLLVEPNYAYGNGCKQTFTDNNQGTTYIRVMSDVEAGHWSDWKTLATATPPQEFDLPLAEGFVHYNPVTKSTYSKSQEGLVIVHFYCKKSDGTDIVPGDTIAMLPEGFRPSANVHIPANISFTGDSVYSQDVAGAVADPTGYVWIAYPPAGCKAVTTTLVFYAAS